jgi:hypothetical protein
MNFQDIIKTALPWIGAAATGNVPGLISLAANAVSGALGVDVKPDAQSIVSAVSGATPEQMIMLKQADNDFAVKMRQLGMQEATDLAKIEADNTKDARDMQKTTRSWIPGALAIGITLGFFGILGAMLAGVETKENTALLILLGSLGTSWGAVVNFFFGSSHSSQMKNETIDRVVGVK